MLIFSGLVIFSANLFATQSPVQPGKPDDSTLRKRIVGIWVSSSDDGDNPSIGEAEYRADGIVVARNFTDESRQEDSEVFEGKWKIENGLLIITARRIFPNKSDKFVMTEDHIIYITQEKMCLRAVGEQTGYCRTRKES
ncbi:MAG TPA: lipocalin family protein [Opitutaceae bacterium]|nr:lipocalin family protein [Opitutaceae bacterium]